MDWIATRWDFLLDHPWLHLMHLAPFLALAVALRVIWLVWGRTTCPGCEREVYRSQIQTNLLGESACVTCHDD